MREHAIKIGAHAATQLEPAAIDVVGKRTHAEHDPAAAEAVAEIGETLLQRLAIVLQSYVDALSKYNPARAEDGKAALEHLAATCGPGSSHVQEHVQAHADKLSAFYVARLLRVALIEARNMASACKDLSEGLRERKPGALLSFVNDTLLAAKDLADEFHDYTKDIAEVEHLVHQISGRCGHYVAVEVPHALQPIVVPKLRYQFYVNPQVAPGRPAITLPGLPLPGGHVVLPRHIELPHGPILGNYVG